MSIVTYFPKGELEFILTISLAETSPDHLLLPVILNEGDKQILYPRDSSEEDILAAASSDGTIVCAFKIANSAKSSYKQYIGKAPLDYFKYDNIFSFYLNYDFQKEEPFIMVIFQDKKLYEIRWDGKNHVVKNLLTKQNYFWSSVGASQDKTMMTKEMEQFESWSTTASDFGESEIKMFHKAIVDRKSYNSLLETEENYGLRIITIIFSPHGISMLCENTMTNTEAKIPFSPFVKQELKY